MARNHIPRTLRIAGLNQAIDEPDAAFFDRIQKQLGLSRGEVRSIRFARRSVDARRREAGLHFVCQVDLALAPGVSSPALERARRSGRLTEVPAPVALSAPHPGAHARDSHVVVVGTGPAGVFAALVLARSGARVTVVDRGARLEDRGRRLVRFHRTRTPDPETNLLFGEGGAGTYSDGKLYTRVDDPFEIPILEELVACGAPEDILFDSRAHVGTDRLHRIVPRLRARLEELGVRFLFETRLDGLDQIGAPGERSVRAACTTAGDLPCDALVLALGHSARDTWSWLAREGFRFEAKPFQLGVRVEHPQELVTRGRYGTGPAVDRLGPASYQLTCRGTGSAASGGVPGAHSFCMCPGGRIVASVAEAGYLCTNGMSNSTHSSRYANAAIVTTFGPDDYTEFADPARGGDDGFAGVRFQRELEARFFAAGGGDYTAPAQRVPDFLAGRPSAGEMRTSYGFGVRPGRIDELLPPRARDALRRALERFDRSIPGFAGPEGVLVGLESRSSGPVRMPRDPASRIALGWTNVYPVGEGRATPGAS